MKKEFFNGSLSPLDLFKTIKYKINFKFSHKDYFDPEGLLTFCGDQGSGKTLSLTNYINHLVNRYPKVVIVSNIIFYNLPSNIKIIYYKNLNQLFQMFDQIHNR